MWMQKFTYRIFQRLRSGIRLRYFPTHSGKVVQVSGYVKSNRLYSSDPSQYSNLRVVVAKIKIDNSAPFKNLIGSQVNVRIITK